ncbi:condensin complex non-SMC subunit Cnd1 [Rhizina undulata]
MDEDERIQFVLNTSLKHYLDNPATVPTPEAASELLDAESEPESLSASQINRIIDPIIDAVATNPDSIARSSIFDSLQCLIKYFPAIPVTSVGKVMDLITSGFTAEAELANQDIEADENEVLKDHRSLLEIYGFLLQWAVTALEARAADKSTVTTTTARGKGKGKGKAAITQTWDSSQQLEAALDAMCKVLKLKLLRIFVTTSERDTFISLFTRPVYLTLENEARVKSTPVKMRAFKVLCVAVKHHGHAFGAQTSIVQCLTYFEHLSEPMAEFLQILSEQYDYPQLVDEILRELSNKEFNSNDTRGPKSVSGFITRLSELAPRLVNKQMTLLIKLLDSESYNLRCAVIEVCGNLIVDLAKEDERTENHKAQINSFFDVLEERFLDVNPYCRCKALQVYYNKLLDLDNKFPKRRQRVADLAARHLSDKSSNVRRNAIKLLTKLVTSHPYGALHGGTLRRVEWAARLESVDKELDSLKPPEETGLTEVVPGNETVDPELLDDATDDEGEGKKVQDTPEGSPAKTFQQHVENAEDIARLQLTRRYYVEALRFIETIHTASPTVSQLLSSKTKSEVIEAMDFFKVLDVHKVSTSKDGIRRMLRLIWTKGNSDEGKGVQTHLLEVYKDLFFEAPDTFSKSEAAGYIARNMISLTFDTTPAELTSLEQLLSKMMREGLVPEMVITVLWQIYSIQKREISKSQRRGAIIVLGMLSLADPEIVVKELETVMRIGLGEWGRRDLVLARWTCVALRHISPGGRQTKDSPKTTMVKLPNEHAILACLAALAELPSDNKEWFGVAEQAIGAIYALSKHPDVLCTDIIRRKTKAVFGHGSPRQKTVTPAPRSSPDEMDVDEEMDVQEEETGSGMGNAFALSQLLFVVGHVAVKQIVHMEICELDFKRRKSEAEKNKEMTSAKKKGGKNQPDEEQDELDLIGGTTEDDFTEAMAHIRERELLYGSNSLLSNFGPLAAEICANNNVYKSRTLQAQATLCMAKLMCVSSEYCERHLPLLITIMERSPDPTTRSNAVIALGDIAVCFNHLIDENTDFLYRRLNDSEPSVKRTCLMTLTFLILAGQVKVKGQLGEMAKCVDDKDRRIADLARMFFTELATKENAVYNHFVDVFSTLVRFEMEEETFKRVVRFLVGFIEKDKHAKQLADKLAARLARAETERQWNDVAFALSLLQHKNEEIQKTVSAGYRFIQSEVPPPPPSSSSSVMA